LCGFKKLKYCTLVLCLIFALSILILPIAVQAKSLELALVPFNPGDHPEDPTTKSTGNPSGAPTDSKETKSGTGGGGDDKGLIASVKDLVKSMGEFVDNVKLILQGKLMDIIAEWIGKQLDKFFKQVNGVLGTAFIYTPPLNSRPWIHSVWSFFFWISIAILVLASVIATGKIFGAKGEGDNMEPLKVLGVAFGLAIASFYLVDLGVFLVNKMSTGILQSTINLVEGLGCNKIKLGDPITGDIIVKLMFTPDAAFGSKTGEDVQLYNVFISKGGIILLLIGYPLLFLIALVALARYLLLVLLTMFSPVWHVGSSLSGRIETMIGFWYQIGRLLLLEVVAGFTWMACTKIQLAEIGKFQLSVSPQATAAVAKGDALGIGVSAIFLVTLILIGYLVFSLLFVAKSWITAFNDPIALGGAGVMLGVSNVGGKLALIGRGLSERFDNPTWEHRSMRLGERAKKAGEIGQKWAQRSSSPFKKGISQELHRAEETAKKASSPVEMPDHPFEIDKQPMTAPNSSGGMVSWTSIRVPVGDRGALLMGISSMPGSPVVNSHPHQNDRILVAPGHINNVTTYIGNFYKGKTRYWSDGAQYVTVENGLPVVRPNPPAVGIYMGPWKR